MEKKLNFFGIETIVESDNQAFLDMAEGSLSFFKQANNKNAPIFKDRKLRVRLFLNDRLDIEKASLGFSKIGTDAFIKDKECLFGIGRLAVKIADSDGILNVFACPRRFNNPKTSLKTFLLYNFAAKKIDFFPLIRMLILFPVFTLLEQEKNIFLLHASAVEFNGRGIIFSGLNSVGKSMMALALTLDKGAKFLTDNFLLFGEDHIYPFPEYIRLRDDAMRLIANISKLENPLTRRYGRNHYILDDKFIAGVICPKILFFPQLSEKKFVRQISKDVAIDRLLLVNDHVKEFHNYNFIGLMSYAIDKNKSFYKKRIETLEKLLSRLSVYEIGIGESAKLADTLEKVILDVH